MGGFYAYPDNTRVLRQPLVCHTIHSYENSQSPNQSLPHHKRIILSLPFFPGGLGGYIESSLTIL